MLAVVAAAVVERAMPAVVAAVAEQAKLAAVAAAD